MRGGISFAFDSNPDLILWSEKLKARKTSRNGLPDEHEVVIRCRTAEEARECETFLKKLFSDLGTIKVSLE